MPAWLTYALLRIGVFAIAFTALLFTGIGWFWSAVVATVIAFCVAFVLFRRQRDAVAAEWAGRRRSRTADEDEEDEEAGLELARPERERRTESEAERERREGRQS